MDFITRFNFVRFHGDGVEYESSIVVAGVGDYFNGWTMCSTDSGLEYLVQKYGVAQVESVSRNDVTLIIKQQTITLSINEVYEFIIDGVEFSLQPIAIQTLEEFRASL